MPPRRSTFSLLLWEKLCFSLPFRNKAARGVETDPQGRQSVAVWKGVMKGKLCRWSFGDKDPKQWLSQREFWKESDPNGALATTTPISGCLKESYERNMIKMEPWPQRRQTATGFMKETTSEASGVSSIRIDHFLNRIYGKNRLRSLSSLKHHNW